MAISVPDWGRKLRLLRTHGPRKTNAEIAAAFGLAESTVRGWQSDRRHDIEPSIPERHINRAVQLFREIVPESFPDAALPNLFLGEYRPLEDAVLNAPAHRLSGLIAAEARTDTGNVLRAPRINTGLVDYDDPDEPKGLFPEVKLGERFSLEFSLGQRRGYVLTLQNEKLNWGIVTFGDKTPSRKIKVRQFVIPGTNANRNPVYLRELDQPGLHRFVCLVCPEPFPESVLATVAEAVPLDQAALEKLAAFYARQPRAQRAIHLLRVAFIPGSPPGEPVS